MKPVRPRSSYCHPARPEAVADDGVERRCVAEPDHWYGRDAGDGRDLNEDADDGDGERQQHYGNAWDQCT